MIYWILLMKLKSMNIKQDCKTYKVKLFKKNLYDQCLGHSNYPADSITAETNNRIPINQLALCAFYNWNRAVSHWDELAVTRENHQKMHQLYLQLSVGPAPCAVWLVAFKSAWISALWIGWGSFLFWLPASSRLEGEGSRLPSASGLDWHTMRSRGWGDAPQTPL